MDRNSGNVGTLSLAPILLNFYKLMEPLTQKRLPIILHGISRILVSRDGSDQLLHLYESQRSNYIGSPLLKEHNIDSELVETIVSDLKRGKAAGIDGITVEHITVILSCHVS